MDNKDPEPVFCKVRFCHFPHAHVTAYHFCGNCKIKGHGKYECKKRHVKELLEENSKLDIMPEELWCASRTCDLFWTHTTSGHVCMPCRKMHTFESCPDSEFATLLRERALLGDDIKFKENAEKFQKENKVYKIICPTCRVLTFCTDKSCVIFGLDQECSICLDNKINRMLPICKHAFSCEECFAKMLEIIPEPIDNVDPNLKKNLKVYAEYKLNIYPDKIFTKIILENGEMYYAKRDEIDDSIVLIQNNKENRVKINNLADYKEII
jgi:hypothetical protein